MSNPNENIMLVANTILVSVGEEEKDEKVLMKPMNDEIARVIDMGDHYAIPTVVKIAKFALNKNADMKVNIYSVVELDRKDVKDYILVAVDNKENGAILKIDPNAENKVLNLIPKVKDATKKDH